MYSPKKFHARGRQTARDTQVVIAQKLLATEPKGFSLRHWDWPNVPVQEISEVQSQPQGATDNSGVSFVVMAEMETFWAVTW